MDARLTLLTKRFRPYICIDMTEYEEFLAYKKAQQKPTMAELLAELREINQVEEDFGELPPRTTRPGPDFD